MRNTLYLMLALISLMNSCKLHQPQLQDFSFLQGHWNSSGTDAYEYWTLKKDTLKGVSLRIIDNQLTKVDSMHIVQSDGKILMILHLAYSQKKKVIYTLVEHGKGDKAEWFFQNTNAFPQQIRYQKQTGSENMLVSAGEDIFNHKQAFDFLYVPVQ